MNVPVNAYYAARAVDFLSEPAENIVGTLTTRSALAFRGLEREQARAWQDQVAVLRQALAAMLDVSQWSLLLEYSLHRLGKRPDTVILLPGLVVVIEFKMGAEQYTTDHTRQAEDYALCIRDFHPAARGIPIVPIACAERAPSTVMPKPYLTDGVASVLRTNGADLQGALRSALSFAERVALPVSWENFDKGGFNPTPTIVEAARGLYRGHSVAEIGRTDADGESLRRTAERLRYWVAQAREKKEHVICLLTGTPGAGKSLLGLNLVLSDGAGRVAGQPAVMLTGNRPLVHVLKAALLRDAKQKGDDPDARRALDGALQTLLDYLREHGLPDAAPPPENVVVFDEAQRAWNEEVGQKLLKRRRSEPALFLEVLDRLPWACLVCLVGPGQEINRGEGGMQLWGAALDEEMQASRRWRVVAPSVAELHTSQYVDVDPALHLSGGLRSYRNERHGQWVEALLSGQISRAGSLAATMPLPPAFLTRSLSELKNWLALRRRGGRRPGLLVSSGAVRLIADGLPQPPMSNELKRIENWFLKSLPDDFRGSDALEVPLSEFGCQGLELDYVGLYWGGDLIWSRQRSEWVPRRMSAPTWNIIRREDTAQFRLNAYRVLLTRAREGVCIFVPSGSKEDRTRPQHQLDEMADILVAAGCKALISS